MTTLSLEADMRRITILALATIGIVACAPDKPPEKTVFDPQVETLKKARELEAQVQKSAEEQRRAIDAASEGKAPAQGY
jgi:outer membrane PBP1 activator LpoA protein